jgi:hypothetical protein
VKLDATTIRKVTDKHANLSQMNGGVPLTIRVDALRTDKTASLVAGAGTRRMRAAHGGRPQVIAKREFRLAADRWPANR